MKKIFALLLALTLVLTACASALTAEEAQQAAAEVTETTTDKSLITSPFIGIIDSVQNSVVGVNNYTTYTYTSYSGYGGFGFGGFGGYGGYGGNGSRGNGTTESVEKLAATGSGVVVYNGLVLTNYHVVEDASRLTVSVLNDETEYECTLIAYDETKDVAVVYAPELKVAPVPMGDSDQLQVGEWVLCIGNPLTDELRGTVTTGIISALDREIASTSTTDRYGLKTTVTNTMIQTDAAINSGNSGGGLFNTLGQLMGIPSMKYSGSSYSGSTIEGIGLAIPINTAKPVITEAIVKILTGDTGKADDVSGTDTKVSSASTDKPMLGVTGSMITSTNSYLVYAGLLPGGMLIDSISDNSPAAAAGIQPYDVIVEIEGEIVTGMTVIRNCLDSHSFGDTITVKVYRCEGLEDAQSTSDIGTGEYIECKVNLFEFNTAA